MDVAYGIRVSDTNDPYISTIQESLEGFAEAGTPGRFLVDQLPNLKYVPSWMPGANFKRLAVRWKTATDEAVNTPYQSVKQSVVSSILLLIGYHLLIKSWSAPRNRTTFVGGNLD
jgi:hypothetical protein